MISVYVQNCELRDKKQIIAHRRVEMLNEWENTKQNKDYKMKKRGSLETVLFVYFVAETHTRKIKSNIDANHPSQDKLKAFTFNKPR